MLFEDTYKTLKAVSQGIYREKGSRFIATAFPVSSENEVKERLAELRKTYHDARHHCYAYILGADKSAYRLNDDGEPSGTAGRPIHGQLLSHDLTNVLIVVVRYFGGIKLGVSGLINAYKTAAKEAISAGEIIEKTINETYEIAFDYGEMNRVMQILKEPHITISATGYDTRSTLTFSVRQREADRFVTALKKVPNLEIRCTKIC